MPEKTLWMMLGGASACPELGGAHGRMTKRAGRRIKDRKSDHWDSIKQYMLLPRLFSHPASPPHSTTLDTMADMINSVNIERLKKGEVNLGVRDCIARGESCKALVDLTHPLR